MSSIIKCELAIFGAAKLVFFIVWFGPFIIHTMAISMATGQHDGPLLFLPLTKLKLSKYQWLFWNWQKYIYL